ncbi:uncharacterized protein LOC122671496 isoform X1 [Telopea speciosissima]|uniref:uncharacterized protein LOC122671496 isoform X1 n=1 Tax=Telopea speciosissima TaxID=54955 RepID=UPI001CC39B5A|nr:uncharacterized protein LOC122671496 isoform X1 [Telopea speciosissima]
MGDLEVWSLQPHGVLNEEGSCLSSLSASSSCNPDPLSISEANWIKAEQTTNGIICRIQPTVVSEQRRKAVIDYIQRLIRNYLGSEVFPFGSVPLKTYLPDGDIDLSAFSTLNAEDALANDVRGVLEVEEQNEAAEFEVKDVQYIHAEVKLVKCLVQNIVVDISFNQVGGLCTLCFLEKIDSLIGKDHLFKRSIILIKAWCYYESRILGAHHGLISTYALETLVLYVFHLFHSSLNGPLAVLFRFLDYFSKFDWDNYCISLNGPVCISALPEIVAETPGNGGSDLLLSKEFLKRCVDMFSAPSRGFETTPRAFPQKHLNIIDPLKENNNLGRSVSKGNFYRIRSAFTYGARKLGRILLLPGESIEGELNKFFMNTLDRHGSGQRPDVQDSVPTFHANGPGLTCSKSAVEKGREDRIISDSPYVSSIRSVGESRIDHLGSVCEGFTNMKISETETYPGMRFAIEPQGYSTKVAPPPMVLDSDGSASGNSGYHLAGDAKDLATSRIQGFRNTSETTKSTSPSTEAGTAPFGKAHHAPHLYFSHPSPKCGKSGNGNSERTKPFNSSISEVSSCQPCCPDEENGITIRPDLEGTDPITSSSSYMFSNYEDATCVSSANGVLFVNSGAYPMEDLSHGFGGMDTAGTAVSPEVQGILADLSGDIESHLRSLQYGRYCQEYAFCGPVMPFPPQSSSQFQNKHAWEPFHQSVPFKHNMFPHPNANGNVSGPTFYPGKPSMVSSGAFGAEEMPKPRGTGTYFPITNHRSYRDRPTMPTMPSMPMGRGKYPAPVSHGQMQRSFRYNDRAVTLPDTNWIEKGSQEQLPVQFPVFPGRGKPGSLGFIQSGRPTMKGFSSANGFSLPSEKLEFGSFGHLPLGARSPDASRQPDPGSPNSQVSMSSFRSPTMQRLRPSSSMNQERVAVQSYHLKDNDDFPPLTI